MGCVRLEQIKPTVEGANDGGVFIVTPPAPPVGEGEVAEEVEIGKRWLAKAFIPPWLQVHLDVEATEER
jgi:hypothetical protein